MKYFFLLPLGIALLTTSCKTTNATKTASTNPYQNNPYYGSSGSTTDYSSTPSSSTYPSYSESTYTPPSSVPSPSVPSVPSVPTYSQPTYSQPAPAYNGNSAPVSQVGSGKTHTVSGGENLYRISLKHGTSVAAIKNANGLSSDTIQAGQKLVIP